MRAVEGGLEIATSEPRGLALLAGVPAAERERYERLGARTADIAGRAFKGDPTGIHEALGGRLGLEQIREQEAQLCATARRASARTAATPSSARCLTARGAWRPRCAWTSRGAPSTTVSSGARATAWSASRPAPSRRSALRPGVGARARGLPPRRRRRPAAARLASRARAARPSSSPGPGRPGAPRARALTPPALRAGGDLERLPVHLRVPDLLRLHHLVPGDFLAGVGGHAAEDAGERRLRALLGLVDGVAARDALDERLLLVGVGVLEGAPEGAGDRGRRSVAGAARARGTPSGSRRRSGPARRTGPPRCPWCRSTASHAPPRRAELRGGEADVDVAG